MRISNRPNRNYGEVIDLSRVSSVNATGPRADTSERYAFVPTTRMVDILRDHGWDPVGATQSRVRDDKNAGFQLHEIRFHSRAERGELALKTAKPEIRLLNSHGGASSFQLWSGILELVCLNGLVVFSDKIPEARIRHQGFALADAERAVIDVVKRLPLALERRESMQRLQLTDGQRAAYAEAAVAVKWGEEPAPVEPRQLLVPTRYEQRSNTLWDTYNTVQERLIRGGVRGRATTGRRMTTRAVGGVAEDLRINKGLWILADRMAQMAGV